MVDFTYILFRFLNTTLVIILIRRSLLKVKIVRTIQKAHRDRVVHLRILHAIIQIGQLTVDGLGWAGLGSYFKYERAI